MTTALISRPTILAGQLIRRGLFWWLSELAQLAPRPLLRLLGHSGNPTTVLALGARHITLILPERGRPSPTMLPLTDYADEDMRARVRLAMRGRRSDDAVTVRLDRDLVFETAVELPAASEPSLRPILQHQIERLVPLAVSEVAFDHRITSRGPASNTLKVRLVIAKCATIDRALALARAAGFDPRRVIAPDGDDDPGERPGRTPLILWQAGRRTTETDIRRHIRHALEIAAIVLSLTAYGLYIHRLDRVRDELQAQVGQTKEAAAAVTDLGRQVGQADESLALLQNRRDGVPPMRVLDELTKLIPEDSWVSQLVMRGRSIELTGYSPRASDLISRVENSAMFENPRFRSPTTLAPDGSGERFALAFDIKAPERTP
ncbi:MAG TPA: PilN domain-containing protein [Stellaceae bacterium]|nr:PilN domain-containing protein [Stellaceae bacterium]